MTPGARGCPTLSEARHAEDVSGAGVAQHAAGHVAVLAVPAVVADRAPAALVEDLQAPLVRPGAVHQPDGALRRSCGTDGNGDGNGLRTGMGTGVGMGWEWHCHHLG